MALAFVFLPFVINWDPLKLLFGSSIPVKLAGSILYGFGVAYNGCTFLSVLLLLIACLQPLQIFNKHLFPRNKQLMILINKISALQAPMFFRSYKKFRIAQHITINFAEMASNFVTAVIFVGILIAKGGTYAALTMWNRIQILVSLSTPALTLICFIGAIVMTYCSEIPRKYGILFHKFWKKRLARKLE